MWKLLFLDMKTPTRNQKTNTGSWTALNRDYLAYKLTPIAVARHKTDIIIFLENQVWLFKCKYLNLLDIVCQHEGHADQSTFESAAQNWTSKHICQQTQHGALILAFQLCTMSRSIMSSIEFATVWIFSYYHCSAAANYNILQCCQPLSWQSQIVQRSFWSIKYVARRL